MRRYLEGGNGGASRGDRRTSVTVTVDMDVDETDIGGEGGAACVVAAGCGNVMFSSLRRVRRERIGGVVRRADAGAVRRGAMGVLPGCH